MTSLLAKILRRPTDCLSVASCLHDPAKRSETSISTKDNRQEDGNLFLGGWDQAFSDRNRIKGINTVSCWQATQVLQYFCSTTRYAVDEQQSDQTLHSLAFQSNSYNSIVSNRFFPTISDENSSAYASYYVRLLQASRPFSRVPYANHRDCFPTHVLCGVTSRIRFFEALDLSGHIGVDFWHVRTRSATKIPQLLHTREHNHQFL